MPGEWSDVCGFLKPLGSENEWQVRMHGTFSIPYSTLGLKEKDHSCHHEVWIPPQTKMHERRPLLLCILGIDASPAALGTALARLGNKQQSSAVA